MALFLPQHTNKDFKSYNSQIQSNKPVIVMKKQLLSAILLGAALALQAQDNKGGISAEMLEQIQQSYQNTASDRAIRNAIGSNSIKSLALNQENQGEVKCRFLYYSGVKRYYRPAVFRALLAFYRA